MDSNIVNRSRGGGGAVKSNAHETSIRVSNLEDINALLEYGYEVDDDKLPAHENKTITTGKTYQTVYK